MTEDNLGVIATGNQSWNVMHDAARPYALVEFGRKGSIRRVISRHVSMDAAKTAMRRERRR